MGTSLLHPKLPTVGLSPSHSFYKSSYQKSVVFLAYSYSTGTLTQEPASSRVTYFILRAYTATGTGHSQHRKKIRRAFGKNAGEWTGRVEISKEEIPGSKCSKHGNILTYSSFKGRTFKLCVLIRWDFLRPQLPTVGSQYRERLAHSKQTLQNNSTHSLITRDISCNH